MHNAFFITGTDTDVGKTFVTASLLKAFLDKGHDARAIKPVQTGCELIHGVYQASDILEYKKINANNSFEPAYAFEFPASPHFSAELENTAIDSDVITDYIQGHIEQAEITLIEGAGGLFVPLNGTNTFLDIMKAVRLPVVLVCKNILGMINHTLLSIEMLERSGLTVAALVINGTKPDNGIAQSNIEYLRQRFSGTIIVLPQYAESVSGMIEAADEFHSFVENHTQFFAADEIDLTFDKNHLWHPYTSAISPIKAQPVVFAKENKLHIQNTVLIDGISSWWCMATGFNNERLNKAAQTQMARFSHVMFAGLTHKPAVDLGKKLLEILPEFDRIFYSDSGSVCVEVALKMALQYQHNINKKKTKILTVLGGYHGDTAGAMSVCDPVEGMHFLFKETLAEQIFTPRPPCRFDEEFNPDLCAEYEAAFEEHKDEIAAVIIEPIVQGAGGMWFYHPKFLEFLRNMCDKYGALLIVDEVATGFGRTGKLFAYQYANIVPDIICIGKAITGGFMSFAATLAVQKVVDGISKNGGVFMHGPTFMGNPLACAVAYENICNLQEIDWQKKVKTLETIMKTELAKCKECASVADVRVLGAIGVVEMKEPVNTAALLDFFMEEGVFIRPFEKTIYLMPPFITSRDDCVTLCNAIYKALKLKKY